MELDVKKVVQKDNSLTQLLINVNVDLAYTGMDKCVYPVIMGRYSIMKLKDVNVLEDRDGMDILVLSYLNVKMVNNGMYIHILVNKFILGI